MPPDQAGSVARAAARNRAQGEAGWRWRPPLAAPSEGEGEEAGGAPSRAGGLALVPLTPSCIEAIDAASLDMEAATSDAAADAAAELVRRPPPSWASLLGVSEAASFEAWCVGRTGASLVDAGMTQLCSTVWMPVSSPCL